MSDGVDFVSLGMFVLDELHLPSGQVLQDCIGGSGAYSTLGARIVTPIKCDRVGASITAGNDFPDEVLELIGSWGLTLELILDDRKSTRGLLEYHDEAFGHKSFRYLTEPLQPVPGGLPKRMLSSKSFHMLRPPSQIVTDVGDLIQRRKAIGIDERPLVVWEPFPSFCRPENLDMHIDACKEVDVFSPNHLELLAVYGEESVDDRQIYSCTQKLLQATRTTGMSTSLDSLAIVVRAGERGCLVADRQQMFWLPSYHNDAGKVVDATGGGNSFLGGFTITLANTGNLLEAAKAGSVAASFAIEQIGLPRRTVHDGQEVWNGQSFRQRFQSYEDEEVYQPIW